jgi:hypothetical protein
MNTIDDFLSGLVKGSTHIISSPKTIEDLQKRGVKFNEVPKKTEDQFLDELFVERRKASIRIVKKFPSAPQIAIPTIGFLYDEIRECILFGQFGAAISLSAVLVEFSLKHAIVRITRGNVYDKEEWDRLENMELGPTINEAKSMNIINDRQEEALKNFKNTVRNPYLHYNIKKIVKKVAANKIQKINVNTQKVEELDLPAEDNPVLWGFAKKFVDRETVFDVFIFSDRMVKELLEV